MIVETIEQLVETAVLVLEDLKRLIVRSSAPKGGSNRLRVSLVLTIAEQFEAVLHLTQAQMCTHAATHARSMIEALVAMKMLESDSDYMEKMQYEKLRGERRVYQGLFDDPNIPAEQKDSVRDRYNVCIASCEEYRLAGYKPKIITADIGAANLAHLVGPYSMLCAFSHNDLAVLAFRHQGDDGMVYRQVDSPQFIRAVISTALMVVMDAANQFITIAKFPEGYSEPIFLEMNSKWAGVLNGRLDLD